MIATVQWARRSRSEGTPAVPAMRLRVATRSAASPDDSATSSGSADDDGGRALIEVVFLAVLLLIPTVYILACVMRIQAATFAVSQGARDAGRVMDAAPTPAVGVARAQEIAQLALTDQRVPADGMQVRFVAPGSDCVTAPQVPPSLRPGDVYDVCVVALVTFPGVPSVVTGSQNTVTGVFTLHVGDFREGQ
jgi:hypothetical protein